MHPSSKPEGFIHRGRIIYSAMYRIVDGSSLIVSFDRDGHDINGRARHSDDRRRIVTAKPGETILYQGEPRITERVEVYRANRAG